MSLKVGRTYVGALVLNRRKSSSFLLLCALVSGAAARSQAQSVPSVDSVITASNFGGFSAIAPGSWVEIHGSNLASHTEGWTFDQFRTPHPGASIGSVQVGVAGQAAFISFTSPGQINVQLPAELPTGPQELTVRNENGASVPFAISVKRVAPGLWSPQNFAFGKTTYVAALFSDGATYALPPGAGVGLGLPAKYPRPGDIITTYGVGFGPVVPQSIRPDRVTERPNCLDLPFRVFFGNTEARVRFAGLAPHLRGFYRFDIVVPDADPRDRNKIRLTFTLDSVRGTQKLFSTESERNATQESVHVNGVTRTYLLYVPRSYRPGESALIIALHGRGGGGPGSAMEFYTDLDDKAEREGFAVAYLDGLPDATGTVSWNYYYNFFYSDPPDDVGFVRKVIDSLQARIEPDRRRIYATGTSAGGFMAQRVGVELSDRVAAIGVVQGQLYVIAPSTPQTIPHATAPVSVIFLKGDHDPINQYCGAVFPDFNVVESSSDQDFDYWTGPSGNQCRRFDTRAPLCLSVGVLDPQFQGTPGVPSSLVEKQATGCKADTEVKLYRLLGGLDSWNRTRMNVPDRVPFNPDLDAHTGVTTNDILWKFFERHPKREHHSRE